MSASKSCAVCQKETDKACSVCGTVFYCSSEHQKQHWKQHKANCRPFKISSNEKFGRFLEATRDIPSGGVILREHPLVLGPDWSYDLFETARTLNCVGCFEPIKMFNNRCPGCKWPCCRPDCIGLQYSKLHGIECPLLKGGLGVKHESDYRSIRDYYRTDVLFALKCLLLQLKSPKKFQELMELQSHEAERKSTENFKESEKQIDYLEENFLNPLKLVEEKTSKVILKQKDRQTLRRIHGIIETNSLYLTTNNSISGLYATGCIIEHSCVPNCHFTFDRKDEFLLTVRAARKICKGEHIATCFSNILWGTQLRRQHLKDMKYFLCCCERCADPSELGTNFSSLRCIGTDDGPCEGGTQTPTNLTSDDIEWTCNKCPARISGEQIASLMGRMGEEIDNVIYKTPTVAATESLLEKLSLFLHPQHYHMFTLKHALAQLYGNHKDYSIQTISMELLMQKLKLCDNLLETLERLDPHNIRLAIYTTVVLYEKFKSIAEMHKRQLEKIPYSHEEAVSCLKSAQMILINELDTIQGKQLNEKISEAIGKLGENGMCG